MNANKPKAPFIDKLIKVGQSFSDVNNKVYVAKLMKIVEKMSALEIQGDDELRRIWITAVRGSRKDFGSYKEYLKAGEVSDKNEFDELWKYYYPDEMKWYHISVVKFEKFYYFYIDSQLIFQCKSKGNNNEEFEFQSALIDWLTNAVTDSISLIQADVEKYNEYLNTELPFIKRTGRILRKDYWKIFPEEKKYFRKNINSAVLKTLDEIRIQSETNDIDFLSQMCANDFFRVCEMGYDANRLFVKQKLTAKQKYRVMADGRDCGLTEIDEFSAKAFQIWFTTERQCGGHPWEIFRGGNSTHISLYVGCENGGWYYRLEGSSRGRARETILMAVALYKNKVPFILGKGTEIYKMATGVDYIGIVPENVLPRYCHSFFPTEDHIIDFMNLDLENRNEIIRHAFWYPLAPVKLAEKPKRINQRKQPK